MITNGCTLLAHACLLADPVCTPPQHPPSEHKRAQTPPTCRADNGHCLAVQGSLEDLKVDPAALLATKFSRPPRGDVFVVCDSFGRGCVRGHS